MTYIVLITYNNILILEYVSRKTQISVTEC